MKGSLGGDKGKGGRKKPENAPSRCPDQRKGGRSEYHSPDRKMENLKAGTLITRKGRPGRFIKKKKKKNN